MTTRQSEDPSVSQPPTGQTVYLAYPALRDDEAVDLGQLLRSLWRSKGMIVCMTLLLTGAGAGYGIMATPVYRAEVVLTPNTRDNGAAMPSGLGSLASLAGIAVRSPSDSTDALAMLRSRIFVEEFLHDRQLLPVLFADQWDGERGSWRGEDAADWPDLRDGVQYFTEDVRMISEDALTGLITLAVEWRDPDLATDWVTEMVQRINERLRDRDLADSRRRLAYLNEQLESASLVELRQAISRLIENEIQTITLAMGETEYAFRVIDPPRVPKEPVAPRRLLIIALAAFLGISIGSAYALLTAKRPGQSEPAAA